MARIKTTMPLNSDPRRHSQFGRQAFLAILLLAIISFIMGFYYFRFTSPLHFPQPWFPNDTITAPHWTSTSFAQTITTIKVPYFVPTTANSTRTSVLVFLHVQKTGGTLLERRLTKDGLIGQPCVCRRGRRKCQCRNAQGDTWLVSRYSTGWICGLHADWTAYTECVNQALIRLDARRNTRRRFIFFTLLRDPVDRYLSEWLHADRGATWHATQLRCNHTTSVPSQHYQPCYTLPEYTHRTQSDSELETTWLDNHSTWTGVNLTTFLRCPYNLAHNRQSRMLANLTRIGCYSHLVNWSQSGSTSIAPRLTVVQRELLNEATFTLVMQLRSFGLCEHLIYTQYLLQRALGIRFNRLLQDYAVPSLVVPTHASIVRANLSDDQVDAIRGRNQVDWLLYARARVVFIRRFVFYLLHDSRIRFDRKRPLRTLWARVIPCIDGLIDLLLLRKEESVFAVRLQTSLNRLLIREGSRRSTLAERETQQRRWKAKQMEQDLGEIVDRMHG